MRPSCLPPARAHGCVQLYRRSFTRWRVCRSLRTYSMPSRLFHPLAPSHLAWPVLLLIAPSSSSAIEQSRLKRLLAIAASMLFRQNHWGRDTLFSLPSKPLTPCAPNRKPSLSAMVIPPLLATKYLPASSPSISSTRPPSHS